MKSLLPNKPIRVPAHTIIIARVLIHVLAFLWLLIVLMKGILGGLEGDPVQYLLDFTGIGSLNLLLLSLSISPLCEHLKFGQLIRIRKTLGVYAGVYALAHFMVFIAFELQFEWKLVLSEVVKRPYITVGFIALLLLSTLLFTSFHRIKVRMGKAWHTLHKTVYLALCLGLLHFLWSIKANELQPFLYIGIGGVLLWLRKEKIKRILKK